ncbi:MAG: undecaprenyldiphospho-muramoylpentapeptide beta-N-acetylglucosaminyltransferase [Anaerolineales bacterium]|nr:undecaprenyldiphospho-muramoylpentapeptide beta-N-acetylglucosaminyltransferase [Anaerolineales bacterium]
MISGGGTGGHVYPALAVVQSLNRLCAEAHIRPKILWVGSVGGLEQQLVERVGLEIELIPAAGLRGKNPVAAAQGLWALLRGYRRSRQIIRWFEPDALFVTGGYVCVPVTIAAHQAGIASLIYLPDIEPGLAIKFLARFVDRVAVTTPETIKYFKPGLAVVTGYPVRSDLLDAPTVEAKAAARQKLGLDADLPVLLVFGGSQGARSINRALTTEIERYLAVSQVVHISGKLDADDVLARRAELAPEQQARYHVSAYLHEEMPSALRAADLVISRAGASVLGEFPAAGLPAILAPYPYAGTHQALNAHYLARHGAAVVVEDANLSGELYRIAIDLLTNKEKLHAMSEACRRLAKPDAAAHLAQEILEVKRDGN